MIPWTSDAPARRRARALLLLGSAVASAMGCSDPLKRLDQIIDTRVIGARVSVDASPERAWPARGQSAHLEWLVVAAQAEPIFGWTVAVCVAGSDGTAVPVCDGKPIAQASSSADTAQPALDFSVPADLVATRLVALGVVCPDSEALLDAHGIGTSCTDGATPTRVSLPIPVADASDQNDNPVLEPDAIALDGNVLAPPGASGCSATLARAPATHRIHVTLRDSDREKLAQKLPQDPPRETLQVSYFTTGGAFEFPLSSVLPDAVSADTDVGFTLPSDPASARTLWLHFVLRDLRGGADWAERVLCLEP